MSDVFPKDGITASFLCGEFLEELGGIPSLQGLTTAQVIQEKIKPKTLQWKSSYCAWLKLRNHPAYHTTAHAFISHGHSYMFLDLISAIQWALHDEPETVVWIDFCAINQHAPMDWTFEWLSTTFKSAIQGMGRTIMVMSPWNDPLPFKRSWCVFEAYCTAEGNCKFEIALSETDEKQFLKDMFENAQGKINDMLNTIRSEKSECCSASDKKAIFAVIRSSVGFTTLDSMVFECYRDWVIQVALKNLDGCTEKNIKYCDLLFVVANLYSSQSDYNKAEPYYREALECAKTLFRNDDTFKLIIMHNLALAWHNQGKYSEAEEMYRTCLDQKKVVHGENHPSMLITMNNLASVLGDQGKYNKAEELLVSCLNVSKTEFGTDHPNTLRVMGSLAWALKNQEKYSEAEDMFQTCLEKQKAILGSDHPDTLLTMLNLAMTLEAQEKFSNAEEMYRKCLELRTTILGENHSDTLKAMNGLAVALHRQGKYSKAEVLYRTCLEKRKAILGNQHPETINTLENLVLMFRDQANSNKIRPWKTTVRLVKIFMSCMSKNRPSTPQP